MLTNSPKSESHMLSFIFDCFTPIDNNRASDASKRALDSIETEDGSIHEHKIEKSKLTIWKIIHFSS